MKDASKRKDKYCISHFFKICFLDSVLAEKYHNINRYLQEGKTMPVMDEFREEREAMKQKGFWERFKYFVYYYKGWVALAAIILITLTYLIYTFLSRKDNALMGAFINAAPTEYTDMMVDEFMTRYAIDPKEYKIYFDTNMGIELNSYDNGTMASYQKLTVYIAAGDLDFIQGDVSIINQYIYEGHFMNLKDLLPDSLYQQLEPYFLYADRAYIEEVAKKRDEDFQFTPTFPDATKPEDMKDPFPVALDISHSLLNGCFVTRDKTPVLVFPLNLSHQDTLINFLTYIYEK